MEEMPKMNGYSKLASLMGPNPEVAIFRRFSTLNAQNLLYLQAELVHLEERLKKCVQADESPTIDAPGRLDRRLYDRDWKTLSEGGRTPGGNGEQWSTILEIRRVLKDYNETLVLQTFLAKHKGPLAKDLKFLQNWMKRPTMGYVYLLESEQDIWKHTDLEDLLAMKPNEQSLASRIVGDFLVQWWHRCWGIRACPSLPRSLAMLR
ncbi:hypothetical protein BCR34DRAFT_573714 [Clohesyomyces aquaticus]|uniref:DUF6594 domain-containing protein n=1 Tax=Clohesyomyces aquaticus TaxID=1231657 RepID=A0A1Y1YYP3_9PLEO|nr:hypothetical protein BCR34DRAFT_573714 [Clohesyomyces aquaticus]